jgi:hypothetical protein
MDVRDWAAVVSVTGSVVFGGAAVVAAYWARKIAAGQAETALRAAIRATRDSVRDIAIKIAETEKGVAPDKQTPMQKAKLAVLGDAFFEAVEDNLNAFEDACAKYLDNKIDRKRFKRMYVSEIRNFCMCKEGHPVHNKLFPEQQSNFKAIWKVFHEWDDRRN